MIKIHFQYVRKLINSREKQNHNVGIVIEKLFNFLVLVLEAPGKKLAQIMRIFIYIQIRSHGHETNYRYGDA